MKPLALARTVAAARVAIGAALLAQPERVTVPWLGREGKLASSQLLGRCVGARDLVLGAGALSSSEQSLAPWLVAALGADTADLVASLAVGGPLPLRGRLLGAAAAGGGIALGAAALAGLKR